MSGGVYQHQYCEADSYQKEVIEEPGRPRASLQDDEYVNGFKLYVVDDGLNKQRKTEVSQRRFPGTANSQEEGYSANSKGFCVDNAHPLLC
ncbi:unnamed protein product [Cylicostephanus goldi]|uniref:Uncharacterized protein n=1 Tax=Cylicostephanus goldi TaxID=71465 RepID=A0A3P6QET2_CYLGO|nr:unnamed protein product [Cylicostephanus goldi]